MTTRYDVAIEDYNRYLVASLERTDAEKKVIIAKIDALANDQAALGNIRGELQARSDELFKLQQDFSEHRLMLQEEREKVARLMNENAVLVAQGEDDRSKIASLIRMRRNELSMQADEAQQYPLRVSIVRPGATQPKRGDVQSMSLRSVVTDYHNNNQPPRVHVDIKNSPAALDAVLQPPPSSALVSALSREIEGLKQQLDAQRRAYENERAIRVVEERDRHQQQEETLRRYSATIDHLQALQNESTRELVMYRHQSQIQERRLHGEIEVLRHEVEAARDALNQERNRHTAGIQMAIDEVDTRHQDVVSLLRTDLHDRMREFRREKDTLLQRISDLTEEAAQLREKLLKEKKAKKRLSEQHKFENEGLQTEVHLMKQHLRGLEKKLYFTQVRGSSVTAADV